MVFHLLRDFGVLRQAEASFELLTLRSAPHKHRDHRWCLHSRVDHFHLKSALPALNRSLWRWKNNHQFRFGRVPCLPCHPVLLPGWGQCPSWPQQEPGILCRRPRREHPPDCRGGQALCRRWPDLHHQLHFPVHKGKGFDPEREVRRPALVLPSSLPLLPAIPLWCSFG